jgi:phosphoglycerol transferase MdoB-like AlkP superfamily enzyme
MNSNNSNGGLGITSVLTIIFVVLKLLHIIDWSWWWVLSPLWIATALFILLIAIAAIIASR